MRLKTKHHGKHAAAMGTLAVVLLAVEPGAAGCYLQAKHSEPDHVNRRLVNSCRNG
jgi:hypothetical protein